MGRRPSEQGLIDVPSPAAYRTASDQRASKEKAGAAESGVESTVSASFAPMFWALKTAVSNKSSTPMYLFGNGLRAQCGDREGAWERYQAGAGAKAWPPPQAWRTRKEAAEQTANVDAQRRRDVLVVAMLHNVIFVSRLAGSRV